jgi:hypothetical protein
MARNGLDREAISIAFDEESSRMADPTPATVGADGVGPSVRHFESARCFFWDCLGCNVVGERRPDYPGVFVSDDSLVVNLWQIESPASAVAFDRRAPMSACITARWPWLIAHVWTRCANMPRVGLTSSWSSLRRSPEKDRRSISWYWNQAAFDLNSPTILASKRPACGSDKTCHV